MLVTLKNILKLAQASETAVGAFNTPNLESIRAVLAAAEEKRQPVILMHAQIHEEMGLCSMEEIGEIMLFMADRASVPVCVHLDHGTDLHYLKRGLEIGFTSVMYDGSELPEQKNIANTCVAVEMARAYGASVEAEIGSMGAREAGSEGGESVYTDPDMAANFVKLTGIDALACAFGTAHGLYFKQPKLDFDRLQSIQQKVSVPLVMHGGSGVSEQDYRKVISLGVRKINYYTYLAKAGGDAVANMERPAFYHDIAVKAMQAMKQDVQRAISLFCGSSY